MLYGINLTVCYAAVVTVYTNEPAHVPTTGAVVQATETACVIGAAATIHEVAVSAGKTRASTVILASIVMPEYVIFTFAGAATVTAFNEVPSIVAFPEVPTVNVAGTVTVYEGSAAVKETSVFARDVVKEFPVMVSEVVPPSLVAVFAAKETKESDATIAIAIISANNFFISNISFLFRANALY